MTIYNNCWLANLKQSCYNTVSESIYRVGQKKPDHFWTFI